MTDSTDVTESTPTPERLRSELPGLLAAIAFCELAGLIPSALTREEIDDWYQTLVFFGGHSPLGGLVTICALLVAIVVTIGAFARVTTRGALLLVPYLAWVAFATTLNYDIWRLNRR